MGISWLITRSKNTPLILLIATNLANDLVKEAHHSMVGGCLSHFGPFLCVGVHFLGHPEAGLVGLGEEWVLAGGQKEVSLREALFVAMVMLPISFVDI